MSEKLRDYILTELDKIDYSKAASETANYPTKTQVSTSTPIDSLPEVPTDYSTQDAFYEALATGLQNYLIHVDSQQHPSLGGRLKARLSRSPIITFLYGFCQV